MTPHEVADKLTEAQRRLFRKRILNHREGCEVPMVGVIRRNPVNSRQWVWTPLGFEVRRILQERAND